LDRFREFPDRLDEESQSLSDRELEFRLRVRN
jgi:hypothetical protein